MDEVVKLVMEKTGIPEETAETAVETVLGFLKDKLPEPIAGQLDGLLEGEGIESLLGGGGLGSLLGGGSGAATGDLFQGLGGLLNRD